MSVVGSARSQKPEARSQVVARVVACPALRIANCTNCKQFSCCAVANHKQPLISSDGVASPPPAAALRRPPPAAVLVLAVRHLPVSTVTVHQCVCCQPVTRHGHGHLLRPSSPHTSTQLAAPPPHCAVRQMPPSARPPATPPPPPPPPPRGALAAPLPPQGSIAHSPVDVVSAAGAELLLVVVEAGPHGADHDGATTITGPCQLHLPVMAPSVIGEPLYQIFNVLVQFAVVSKE